jgi:hypothetical protein
VRQGLNVNHNQQWAVGCLLAVKLYQIAVVGLKTAPLLDDHHVRQMCISGQLMLADCLNLNQLRDVEGRLSCEDLAHDAFLLPLVPTVSPDPHQCIVHFSH